MLVDWTRVLMVEGMRDAGRLGQGVDGGGDESGPMGDMLKMDPVRLMLDWV